MIRGIVFDRFLTGLTRLVFGHESAPSYLVSGVVFDAFDRFDAFFRHSNHTHTRIEIKRKNRQTCQTRQKTGIAS